MMFMVREMYRHANLANWKVIFVTDRTQLEEQLGETSQSIGYTGTPIDATERWFGDYIDTYTMRQSIDDGVTLEIVYEGRTHTSCVKDADGMDTTFKNVFKDYTAEECLEILGYGSKVAYLEANSTIEAKAKDMVAHYLTHVYPNGYKAQRMKV